MWRDQKSLCLSSHSTTETFIEMDIKTAFCFIQHYSQSCNTLKECPAWDRRWLIEYHSRTSTFIIWDSRKEWPIQFVIFVSLSKLVVSENKVCEIISSNRCKAQSYCWFISSWAITCLKKPRAERLMFESF